MNDKILPILLITALAPLGASAGEISRDEVASLYAECDRQRQEKLAPLKAQEIEDCVEAGRGDRAYCERYNSDFGERIALAGGGTRPGLFYDLPVCEKAYDAERYFNINPSADTYSP